MSRLSLFVTIIICILIAATSFSQNLLSSPEGVVFDLENNRYFVSNWGSGTIVEIDSVGMQKVFVSGLTSCSGMLLVENTLYVSRNNRDLLGFNIESGELVFTMNLSFSGLHGITIDSNGFLYVADWGTNSVYKVDVESETSSVLAHTGLSNPLGIEFDAVNNRLIVVSFGANNNIQAVDITTGVVTTIVNTGFPNLDDITIDQNGNYYISVFDDNSNKIYKYDHNFTSEPELIVSNTNKGLIDIFYNQHTNILAHTDYSTNSITFKQMEIIVDADTDIGWVPFDVQFSSFCEYNVSSWDWEFNGGGSSTSQNPIHSFTTPGINFVSLRVVTSDDDTLFREYQVICLADSLVGESVSGFPDESVGFPILLTNNLPIHKIVLPVEFQGNLPLSYDSLSLVGCRTEDFQIVSMVHYDGMNDRFTFNLISSYDGSVPVLPVGSGLIAKIYFSLSSSANLSMTTEIQLDGYVSGSKEYLPSVENSYMSYTLIPQNGLIQVGCCVGFRGNVNNDPLDIIDISDLIFMVSYMFQNGEEPECMDEVDVNASGGLNPVDISDVIYLVSYMFQGGDEPATCP